MGIRKRFAPVFADVPVPTDSPWGQVQTHIKLGEGMYRVHTASHGGIFLSGARNQAIPFFMRRQGGWYEEDVEACIPEAIFEQEFQHMVTLSDSTKIARTELAKQQMRNWYPDQYARHYGVEVKPGESRKKDEDTWRAENAENYVLQTAWGSWAHGVPKGMVAGMFSKGDLRGAHSDQIYLLITKEDYDKNLRDDFGVVVKEPLKYKVIDPDTFDPHNTKKQAENGTSLEEMRRTKTVKIELVLTYDLIADDGGEREEPRRWKWDELLDLGNHESVQVIDQQDY